VVELLQRIHQPYHARVHQIFQLHMPGQALVNAAGNVTYLRQLLDQQPLADFFIRPWSIRARAGFLHGVYASPDSNGFGNVSPVARSAGTAGW